MKKLAALLAFSTVLAYGAAARAADVEAPAVYDWTGFYIGGNIGYAFGGDDKVGLLTNGEGVEPGGILGGNVTDIDKLELHGIFGGGQIGYDWQTGSIVFGAIADIEASAVKDSFNAHIKDKFDFDVGVNAKDNIDVWGTVRARLGWAFDRVLIYGTGGLAWADINYKVRMNDDDEGVSANLSDNSVRVGWTAGGGIAWAIDENWSIGAEYLYVNFGEYSIKGPVVFKDDGDPTGETLETEPTPEFSSIKGFVNFKF